MKKKIILSITLTLIVSIIFTNVTGAIDDIIKSVSFTTTVPTDVYEDACRKENLTVIYPSLYSRPIKESKTACIKSGFDFKLAKYYEAGYTKWCLQKELDEGCYLIENVSPDLKINVLVGTNTLSFFSANPSRVHNIFSTTEEGSSAFAYGEMSSYGEKLTYRFSPKKFKSGFNITSMILFLKFQ